MNLVFPRSKRIVPLPGAPTPAPEPRRLQPVTRQVVNAAKAVARNAASVAKGNDLTVDAETAERRFEICKACPAYIDTLDRCAHPACNCFLRAKTRLFAEKCPATPPKW